MSALDIQVGGDHYKAVAIQPVEYTMVNNLDFCQGSIIKYVTRFRTKGGIADLQKAKHFIDMLIEFETRKAAKPVITARDAIDSNVRMAYARGAASLEVPRCADCLTPRQCGNETCVKTR